MDQLIPWPDLPHLYMGYHRDDRGRFSSDLDHIAAFADRYPESPTLADRETGNALVGA